ncbi:hypothetical protein ABIF65_005438 [Bradyrhizobium japonicum]|nr:hypothetical protein [Bradyrhizobium japonicum]MCP1861487.1 hypothetical protein [Bradyrhizobium japonicum]MCP1892247.1 hypothetical protein [Bradyrhizobium japonicum]MCW2325369.1 hypothetical protein [Bradyrhizobium japonicum]
MASCCSQCLSQDGKRIRAPAAGANRVAGRNASPRLRVLNLS